MRGYFLLLNSPVGILYNKNETLEALCAVCEVLVPLKWQIYKTISLQGHAAVQGVVADKTRLFHLCASEMLFTREGQALRTETDENNVFMRGARARRSSLHINRNLIYLTIWATHVLKGIAATSLILTDTSKKLFKEKRQCSLLSFRNYVLWFSCWQNNKLPESKLPAWTAFNFLGYLCSYVYYLLYLT